MKLSDYINQLPIGGVVTNKRLLSVLKRKGLIFDYSRFGYLDSCYIYYNEEYRGRTILMYRMLHLYPKGNSPRIYRYFKDGSKALQTEIVLNCNIDELNKTYGYDGGVIEYKGDYFTMQYLVGCLNPYLVKCDEKGQ